MNAGEFQWRNSERICHIDPSVHWCSESSVHISCSYGSDAFRDVRMCVGELGFNITSIDERNLVPSIIKGNPNLTV